jgi:hypothetical protein
MTGPVLGVVGGSGGVGASTFAAVLAATAGRSTLVDIDTTGGGIEVLLGVEDAAGARWSGLRLGGGRLEPALLRDGLPRWGPVSVLAADTEPAAGAVRQVLDAAAELGPVVVDLGRAAVGPRQVAVSRCALVLLVAAAEVRGLSAARAVAAGLSDVPVGLVVRHGAVAPDEAAALTGVRLVGVAPSLPPSRERVLDARRLPRALVRLASGVLDGMAARPEPFEFVGGSS